ncbi:OB-fold-containig protein [Bradyrhizobium sp. CCBAU 51753]|uniref:OB-fold-containig protein n=1 Tax=Bradyrhizobium sp. CCBAU 51753 TaxID=1325100 RepID=UPI00188A987B|nr:OB-fold-containig protein [Bradyrhizobium sp. CCBAU 51753]QOZ26310.1 hypothetical protein XH93_23935 [Bradyrhizobium sp. CCBAU 51753]
MSVIGDLLLAPDVRPFAIAAAIMVTLGGIELVSMLVGFSISELFGKEVAAEGDNHGTLEGLFLWVNAGHLPLLILLILVLGYFSIIGFVTQAFAHGIGLPVPAWVAALVALVWSLPLTRVTSRKIARIILRDESYAVEETDFVGHIGEVTVGPLDHGLPGRVRLKDVFGNWHTVPARAGPDSEALPVGASVQLVDRDAKSFVAIAAPADLREQRRSTNRA